MFDNEECSTYAETLFRQVEYYLHLAAEEFFSV